MRKATIIPVIAITILVGLITIGYYLTQHVDWARIYYKRLKAADNYVYDEIAPNLKKTEPSKLIRINSHPSAKSVRKALTSAIWGTEGLPTQKKPKSITDAPPDQLRQLPGLAAVDVFRIPVDIGYAAYIYLLHPNQSNGRLIIYQHGYAGTAEQDMAPLFIQLLNEGYTVAASNYPEYGRNRFPYLNLKRFGWYTLSHDRIVSVHPKPIRFYVEPIIVLINALRKNYEQVDMVGFSAGGWISTIAAAVDQRISRTVTVAGGYPIYLRVVNFERESPPPQFHQPLLQAANYLEMYVLAAEGKSRSLTQIFNRYDRCCYRNTYARLYEPAIKRAISAVGQGHFEAFIDETHADHKVSGWAIDQIISILTSDR